MRSNHYIIFVSIDIIIIMAEFHRLKPLHDADDDENKPTPEWTAWNRVAETLAKSASPADMPRLDHLTRADYLHVYEPAEDTFLLIDALRYEFEQGTFDSDSRGDNSDGDQDFVLVEIGCGTGVPTVWFRHEWARRYPLRALRTYVTDINPKALQVALRTDEENNGCNPTASSSSSSSPLSLPRIQAFQCDLATDLLESLAGSVDVLIFNPPYVPTPDEEVVDFSSRVPTTSVAAIAEPTTTISGTSNNDVLDVDDSIIAAAWAGGTDGRRVVDRALIQIQHLLKGQAYLVTVDDNYPCSLAQLCAREYQLQMRPLFRRRAHNEYLSIQRISPSYIHHDDDDNENS